MKSLRVLIVEDSRNDADLIVLELERNDFNIDFERVDTAEDMRSALSSKAWDIILCDNAMPQLNATSALQVLKETELDIPFIIVSEAIGEDLAVSCMKAGAHDFIMKSKLGRLGPAVGREIREAEIRREYKAARHNAEAERKQLLIAEQAARADAERLYKEATRANKLKDDFLATVSHELRTPLNAILGWAELLQQHKVEPEGLDQALDVIYRNANAQLTLINDLLDISRIISGKMELHTGPVDLSTIVMSVMESCKVSTEAKNLQIKVVSEASSSVVIGDQNRLRQVVWNLFSNAVKFTPVGGRVTVTLREVNSKVELSIEDTGEGIDSEFLPFVFERFRQETSSLSRTHGGLGIGLGIAREIVAAHAGDATVYSQGKGKGSTFTVRIPALPVLPPLPQGAVIDTVGGIRIIENEASSSDLTGSGKMHKRVLDGVFVLVIEDSEDSRLLVKMVLEQFGAHVVGVDSAKNAFENLKTSTPDVVLCDISMPEMDGYGFIEALRSRESQVGGHIPAAAFTAHVGAEDRKRAIASGFEAHISKPVATQQLIGTVAKLCRREAHV